MPGLCGIVTRQPHAITLTMLKRMVDSMRYEPFYKTGMWFSEESGVYLGWVSIQDAFADCMPVWNERKDCVLFFSGEHLGDKQDIIDLKSRKHAVQRPNASYLVHLYEEQGDAFVRQLNGWFHGVLVDLREGRGIIFNDRFGIQRLYYYQTDEGLYFSSEEKALLLVRPELREIDPLALAEWVHFGAPRDGRTLFKNVCSLPRASAWRFDRNGPRPPEAYFSPAEWESQTYLGSDYFCERVEDLLRQVLPRYLRSEQPIGFCMSADPGDRLVANLGEISHGKVPCYTFVHGGLRSHDIRAARGLAQAISQTHISLELGSEFCRHFADLAASAATIGEGGAILIAAIALYFAREARDVAPVALTSALWRQVLHGAALPDPAIRIRHLFEPDLESHVKRLEEQATPNPSGHPVTATLFERMPPWVHHVLSVLQSQLSVRTPFIDLELLQLAYRAPPGSQHGKKTTLRIVKEFNPLRRPSSGSETPVDLGGNWSSSTRWLSSLRTFLQRRQYLSTQKLSVWDLVSDRSSGAWVRRLLQRELSNDVQDILLDPRSKGRSYWHGKAVEEMVRDHIAGRRDCSKEIQRLLGLELRIKHVLDSSVGDRP